MTHYSKVCTKYRVLQKKLSFSSQLQSSSPSPSDHSNNDVIILVIQDLGWPLSDKKKMYHQPTVLAREWQNTEYSSGTSLIDIDFFVHVLVGLLAEMIQLTNRYRVFIKYCVFFQKFWKVCHLSLASTRLLLVVQKITRK